jgi:hypothetical protein
MHTAGQYKTTAVQGQYSCELMLQGTFAEVSCCDTFLISVT